MTALHDELRSIIAQEGLIPVGRYMALCLGHPAHGYYASRDPFGAAGDFTTAPEISQMFGEMIGLWAVDAWARMGEPSALRLVELGPGRGTLMADFLRAARVRPAFLDAASVHLVETSAALREKQRERLREAPVEIAWHKRFAEIPPGPAIVIANEFFDALPIRQYVLTERGWCERLVGTGDGGELVFGLAPEPERRLATKAHLGAVLEQPVAALAVMSEVGARLAAEGGAGLFFDYGYEGPAISDTLQAVKRHAFADPLAEPGEADLTAHVDFSALAAAAREAGADSFGPTAQGDFLRSLGIEARAAVLKRRATPAQASEIDAALQRLTGDDPSAMGRLFKVLGVAGRGVRELPGFVATAPVMQHETVS